LILQVSGVAAEDLRAADSHVTVVRLMLFGAEVALTAILCRYLMHDIRHGKRIAFKLVLLSLLVAAVVIHLLAIVRGATLNLNRNYNIYDAAHSAVARWWMPFKANTADVESLEGFSARGSPGRWAKPDDNSGEAPSSVIGRRHASSSIEA
jgi:hypothetical protein